MVCVQKRSHAVGLPGPCPIQSSFGACPSLHDVPLAKVMPSGDGPEAFILTVQFGESEYVPCHLFSQHASAFLRKWSEVKVATSRSGAQGCGRGQLLTDCQRRSSQLTRKIVE